MWGLIAALVLAVVSICYRRHKSRALLAIQPDGTIFAEVWVSGRSTKSWLTRWGALDSLRVSVTKKALVVHPHFPFTLGFMPELLDLEHVIPLSSVISIAKARWWFTPRPALAIVFDSSNGRKSIELALRNPGAFLMAMRGEWP